MSPRLTKARLLRLTQVPGTGKKGKASYQPDPQGAFEVQLNPTSLKISRSNNIDKGGATTNTQKRQTPSVQPATLAFDLEFDSAEGDGSGGEVDVRTLTHVVRQFTEPTKEKPQDPPPAVRFIWGTFAFTGIVTQLTEDLDYFSHDGRPLRAKVSLTITEQNPDWEAGLIGAGAHTAAAARAPGGGGGAPGRSSGPGGASSPGGVGGAGPGAGPTANPVSSVLAQAGQSIQQHDMVGLRAKLHVPFPSIVRCIENRALQPCARRIRRIEPMQSEVHRQFCCAKRDGDRDTT